MIKGLVRYMYMAKIDLTIPFSLGQITLGQYQDYLKILDKWDKEDHVYLKMNQERSELPEFQLKLSWS